MPNYKLEKKHVVSLSPFGSVARRYIVYFPQCSELWNVCSIVLGELIYAY